MMFMSKNQNLKFYSHYQNPVQINHALKHPRDHTSYGEKLRNHDNEIYTSYDVPFYNSNGEKSAYSFSRNRNERVG